MRAYVSIRGSRSPRRVDRDASPGKHEPYAALVLTNAEDVTTRYELQYEYSEELAGWFVTLYEHKDGDRRRAVVSREP